MTQSFAACYLAHYDALCEGDTYRRRFYHDLCMDRELYRTVVNGHPSILECPLEWYSNGTKVNSD